jgi:hypothetical protein
LGVRKHEVRWWWWSGVREWMMAVVIVTIFVVGERAEVVGEGAGWWVRV